MKGDEIGWACVTRVSETNYIHISGWRTRRKEYPGRTRRR